MRKDTTMKQQIQNNVSTLRAVRRLREILIGAFVALGILLVLVSLWPTMPPDVQTIIRSFGLSLAPGGIVAWILIRYASSIAEISLRETVATTIKERLKEDIKDLDSVVSGGMCDIAGKVTTGIKKIEADMQGLSPLFAAAAKLGLENVHLTRGIGLTSFAWFLDAEAQKAESKQDARVWIISSSIKGFLDATSESFDGRRMMERISRCGCDLRIMMTDPSLADLRAKQEHRAAGEIPGEVKMNLAYLKRIGVQRESVRFYPGTPTVFAIVTSDRMLLNPYPYQTEAFRCFSVIVHKTLNPDSDIYHQYQRYHFDEPWDRATEISADEWNKL
jgi:hypothetical protein